MVGKEIWGDVTSKALRRHLKTCKDNVCQCISTFFDKQNGGHDGMAERFDRMMAPNAVKSGIPTHADQIIGRQRALDEANDLYNNQGCGGPGAPAHAPISEEAMRNATRGIPTIEDWETKHGRPMPEGDYKPGQHSLMTTPEDSGGILDWEYWEEVTGLTGVALGAYLIISEGSRLFPARNLVPIP
ncbi:hypothetical protein SAMN04487972_1691 [Paracoccus halophilus]|uniref:Uncharacterized protein n=1 Tax=Paracoccus halophilus TaxID=376733 RepID=A0A099EUB7_9RHOB|nr:hypothetical protein [Paracoccus halophilus]KGJ01592.1 hypothetical protein IT41_19770 [Paracoccus halophilus]SFA62741.1 hypothetical protein SAMN04487972_1691 [Paracoccus halophilus]